MYLEHFGLDEPPFSITPDPRFVFLSERHRDALAHLRYGIGQGGGGGFVQLTGEVGTGKTTLCRLLLEQLPEHARVALVLNPRLDALELLETICEELRLDLDGARGSAKQLVDRLNAYLLEAYAQGLCVVLIIDEAQNLPVDALEQVRLLTNLETATQKLLQIVLLGQPELRSVLAREDMRQLAQRITARFHLTPLGAEETGDYLRHRFAVAGGKRFPFDAGAIARIHKLSGGVPRLINVLAERSLLAGYVYTRHDIDAALVNRAADEVLPARAATAVRVNIRWPRVAQVAAATAVLAICVLGLSRWLSAPVAQATTSAPVSRPVATTPRVDRAAAARALLGAWRLPDDAARLRMLDDCPPLFAPGIYCMHGRSDLDTLASFGRPALLLLDDGRTVLLEGVRNGAARFGAGDASLTPDMLAAHWQGDYTALASASEVLATPLPAGARGPVVDWLRARLGRPGPAVVDADLREAVRAFQRANALADDGRLGPATRLRLAAAETGPRMASDGE